MDRIIVGFDGSHAATAALRWAVAEADHHDAKLEAWTVFGGHLRLPVGRDTRDRLIEADRITLAGLVEQAAGDSAATYQSLEGDPADELVRLSSDADLLVVGGRPHGAVRGLLLGSVSQICLHGAHSPVAVVRADQHVDWVKRPVVVGIDGSPAARVALSAAAEEARVRRTGLHVVHAVHWGPAGYALLAPADRDLLSWGRRLVDAELRRADLDVPVHSYVLSGRPADVLTRYSTRAALLVIGSRHHGGLPARLGSVAARCAAEAACPVLVTRS